MDQMRILGNKPSSVILNKVEGDAPKMPKQADKINDGDEKIIDTGLQISQARINILKFFKLYSELLFKFGEISFQEYVSLEIFLLVVYDDLI